MIITCLRPATLLKKDSETSVFLWILRNFYENIFYKYRRATAFIIIAGLVGLYSYFGKIYSGFWLVEKKTFWFRLAFLVQFPMFFKSFRVSDIFGSRDLNNLLPRFYSRVFHALLINQSKWNTWRPIGILYYV